MCTVIDDVARAKRLLAIDRSGTREIRGRYIIWHPAGSEPMPLYKLSQCVAQALSVSHAP